MKKGFAVGVILATIELFLVRFFAPQARFSVLVWISLATLTLSVLLSGLLEIESRKLRDLKRELKYAQIYISFSLNFGLKQYYQDSIDRLLCHLAVTCRDISNQIILLQKEGLKGAGFGENADYERVRQGLERDFKEAQDEFYEKYDLADKFKASYYHINLRLLDRKFQKYAEMKPGN